MIRRHRIALALGLLFAGGACASLLDLDGKACPCLDGYVCCHGFCRAGGSACPEDDGGDPPDGAEAAASDGNAPEDAEASAFSDARDGAHEADADAGLPSTWLAVGGDTTCARREGDGGTFCWGSLWTGFTTTDNPSPSPVADSYEGAFVDACSTYDDRCFRDRAGNVVCNGRNFSDLHGFPIRGMVQLACGYDHACARTSVGKVVCWGVGSYKQLGRGDAGTPSNDPQPPAPADIVSDPVADVAAGNQNTCVITEAGAVLCWGWDFGGDVSGQPGTSRPLLGPVTVAGIPPAKRLSLGFRHSCALTRDGEVYCWGDSSAGQLGGGTGPAPLRVQLPRSAVDLRVGSDHSCVILDDARIFCWGDNNKGAVGIDSGAGVVTPPQWTGLSGASLLGVGGEHACALVALPVSGLVCWGSNSSGQLGIGNLTTASVSAPTPVVW